MPDNPTAYLRYQGYGQSIRDSQRFDDELFRMTADRHLREC
jgi:hypothetical protein